MGSQGDVQDAVPSLGQVKTRRNRKPVLPSMRRRWSGQGLLQNLLVSQDDDLLCRPGDGRVDQRPVQQSAWKHRKNDACELASLGLVDGDGISKIQVLLVFPGHRHGLFVAVPDYGNRSGPH